jgi:SPP1 family predicted phage head-tail adaptor
MALQDYLNKTVTIERQAEPTTITNMGGVIEVWNTHLTIPCLIDLIRPEERRIANQFMADSTHVLMTNTGYDINIADRVNFNGKIYRITHVDEPFSKQAEILLQEVVDNV